MQTRTFLQPFDGRCGDELISLLALSEPEAFKTLFIVAAFAKRSGVARLWDALYAFKLRQGTSIKAFIGIDVQGTTYEALELLQQVCDQVYIIHSSSDITFHPKMYVLEREGAAVAIVGSNNLTAGGLWTNVEGFVRIDFALPTDQGEYAEFQRVLAYLMDTSSSIVEVLDEELMVVLRQELPDERHAAYTHGSAAGTTSPLGISAIFGHGPTAHVPRPSDHVPLTTSVTHLIRETGEAEGTEFESTDRRTGFWKKLSRNDVSATSSPGQIIIPRRFADLFPSLTVTQEETIGGQREISFTVLFQGVGGADFVDDARFIEYTPAATHLRPNVEYRFTFRKHSINPEQLAEGDVLVFLRTEEQTPWFEVIHVPVGSSQYERFEQIGQRYAFINQP